MNKRGLTLILLIAVSLSLEAGPPQISHDRDLLPVDLTKWDCASRMEGSAKTPDGVERNRLKNRSAPVTFAKPKSFDVEGFLKYVSDFDAQTKGTRRKDISPGDRQKLESMEKEIVQVTGYLGLAYAGPPETTNCGDMNYHDWHLEIVAKPPDHAPQIGDPTAVICEITPRTQNAVYATNFRVQAAAGFFRKFDLDYESTGHRAQLIRLTGYMMWDDEHNGSADVGTTIEKIGANKYHNPWRRSAWEIHPVIKIEPADAASFPSPGPNEQTPSPTPSQSQSQTQAQPSPPPEQAQTATPPPAPSVPATPTPVQSVTLLKPFRIKIPYGETVLPRGVKLKVISHDAQNVTVEYMGQNYSIPITSTNFH